jgi:hypothetical protein
MALPTPQYLSPGPQFKTLGTVALAAVPDVDTLDPALVPADHRFNPAGASAVELYWNGTGVPVGATVTMTVLRYDGIAGAFIYAAQMTHVPPNTSVLVPTAGSSMMAALLTTITAIGATNLIVRAAQASSS